MASRKITRATASGPKTEWLASFNHKNERYRKRGFPTKKAADKWVLDEIKRLDEAPVVQREERTVAAFLKEWLRAVESGHHGSVAIERSTLQGYTGIVNNHLVPVLGTHMLAALTAPHVAEARGVLLKTRSRQIAQRALKFLRMALNYAVELGYMPANPSMTVSVKNAARDETKVKLPTRDEMTAIIGEVVRLSEEKPKRWMRFATLFMVLQGTGMRISEARGLTWRSVDLINKTLDVMQRADQFNKLGRPKSKAGNRRILLDANVVSWLTRWQALCPKGDLDLVFPNGVGKPEGYANFYHRDWVPICKTLKLVDENDTPRFAFHGARHFRVSDLIARGVSVAVISQQAGHANPTITQNIYGHLFEDDMTKLREVIDTIPSSSRSSVDK